MPLAGSKYQISQFGYIPKSDTFKYLTVTEGFTEKKKKKSCYEIGNDQISQIWQIPDYVQTVNFKVGSHALSQIGPYVMILPPAVPGVSMGITFSANHFYPLLQGNEKTIDNIALDDMEIGIKCCHSDAFRGLKFSFETQGNNIEKLPFDKGAQMALITHQVDSVNNNRNQVIKMDELLVSHADVECVERGYWKAKFYGPWTLSTGNI